MALPGTISVYSNGELAGDDNLFQNIHGLNFVGSGVTVVPPALPGPFPNTGIATVQITVIDQLNVDTIGRFVYNSPSGLLAGAEDLVYNNGNIGVGSDTPNVKLDVVGDANFTGTVTAASFFGDGSNITGITSLVISSQNDSITTPVYPTLASDTGINTITVSKNKLSFIPSSGSLGIGTTNPESKVHITNSGITTGEALQVDGNLRVGFSSESNYIAFRGTYGDGVNEDNTGDEGPNSPRYTHTFIGERIYEPSTQRSELLLFKGNDTQEQGLGKDRIRYLAATHLFETYETPLAGSFEAVANSKKPVGRLVITRIGNVGIGTQNPDLKLVVDGDIKATGGVIGSTLYLGTGIAVTDVTGTQTPPLQVELTPSTFQTTGITIVSHEPDSLASSGISICKTRGTEHGDRTLVQSGDRIFSLNGQAADGEKLCVATAIRAYVDGEAGLNQMPGRFDIAVAPPGISIVNPNGNTSFTRDVMRINSEGNVLINNTTGTEKLTVDGNIKASQNLIAINKLIISEAAPRQVGPGTEGRTLHVESAQLDGVGASFIKNINDSSAGQVVLAKTRSTSVGGTEAVLDGDSLGTFSFAGTGPSGNLLSIGGGFRAVATGSITTDVFGVNLIWLNRTDGNSQSEKMRLTSDGNVLINNTTGTEKLSVEGNVQITNTSNSYMVGINSVVGSRKTGWSSPTGISNRTSFATNSVTTEQLAERLKALIDDLISHGLIGT